MNPKHQAFADDWLIHKDATKAAKNSGYSEKTAGQIGYQLLQNPSVAAYIKERSQSIAEKIGVNAEYVLGSFKKVAERSLEAEPVLDKEGNPIGEYTFNAAGANKALEMLGKHLKLFDEDDKKQMNVSIQIVQF